MMMSEKKKEVKKSKPTTTCPRCGNVWEHRVENPKECPDCKYRLKYGEYTTISKEYTCVQCGHNWKSRRQDDADPNNCPKCKSTEYTNELVAKKEAEKVAKEVAKDEEKPEEVSGNE